MDVISFQLKVPLVLPKKEITQSGFTF